MHPPLAYDGVTPPPCAITLKHAKDRDHESGTYGAGADTGAMVLGSNFKSVREVL